MSDEATVQPVNTNAPIPAELAELKAIGTNTDTSTRWLEHVCIILREMRDTLAAMKTDNANQQGAIIAAIETSAREARERWDQADTKAVEFSVQAMKRFAKLQADNRATPDGSSPIDGRILDDLAIAPGILPDAPVMDVAERTPPATRFDLWTALEAEAQKLTTYRPLEDAQRRQLEAAVADLSRLVLEAPNADYPRRKYLARESAMTLATIANILGIEAERARQRVQSVFEAIAVTSIRAVFAAMPGAAPVAAAVATVADAMTSEPADTTSGKLFRDPKPY
jgi:hypothetical protein